MHPILLIPAGLLLLGSASPPQHGTKRQRVSKRVVATLGVETVAPSTQQREQYSLPFEVRVQGQLISSVQKGSPASRAGVKPGEVLLALDNNAIYSRDDVQDFLRTSKPKQKVALHLRSPSREDRKLTVELDGKEVTVAAEPEFEWQYASRGQLETALARAKKEQKPRRWLQLAIKTAPAGTKWPLRGFPHFWPLGVRFALTAVRGVML